MVLISVASLVIRAQFGKAMFLFSGDLETAGDNQLVNFYGNNALLDVDVWKVSHHAAVNGTSATLLAAITPQYAVILCGQ
jgi:competence protein ComEC